MRHKHADILIAIAEGKEVQWRISGDDGWFEAEFKPYTPLTNPNFEWRIKPEPKPDVVEFLNIYRGGYKTKEEAIYCGSNAPGVIKTTFDGETGKLKSAEVMA
jgi:hypothetical protein